MSALWTGSSAATHEGQAEEKAEARPMTAAARLVRRWVWRKSWGAHWDALVGGLEEWMNRRGMGQ